MSPFIKRTPLLTTIVALIVLAMGLSWTGDYSAGERIVTVRYLLFALSGFIAFATPYLFFPDKNTPILQQGNMRGGAFLGYLMQKQSRFYSPFCFLLAVLLFGDLNDPTGSLGLKAGHFIYAVTFTTALNLMALSRYVKSGRDSQFWQESEKGREMRRKVAYYFKYPIDPGSIPSLINTLLLTTAGMVIVIAGALLESLPGAIAEPVTGLLFLAFGAAMTMKLRDEPGRHFYPTNAFFSEFFGGGAKEDSVTERREAEQLWWVPSPIRANVWQFLQQTDRRIPAGRVVAAGHALVWFIAYQRPEEEFLTTIWVLFAISHHFFVLLTMQGSISPSWLHRWMGSPFSWLMSRFWMQVRWILPLVVSMSTQLFVFGVPGFAAQGLVLAVFLTTGFALASLGAFRLKREVS
ncbi:MAG: hypothetical protein JJU46_13040 [Balneolaceae bacterium]|nr:hypothetical protein [Balneolaceae bacterium]